MGWERTLRAIVCCGWLLAALPAAVCAQEIDAGETEVEPLETDRDSFTPATTSVGNGRWMIESAYSFIDNRETFDTHSFPETVCRYGIGERFEFRVGWNYEVGGGGNVVSAVEGDEGLDGAKIERESRMLYGFKLVGNDQQSWIPQTAMIVHGFTPTSGEESKTEAAVTYVWGWLLPAEWKLDGSIRCASATTEEGDKYAIWSPSTVLRVPLTEQFNLHVEYFGATPQGREGGGVSRHFASSGVHYTLTPDLELGVRFGWGLNQESAKFFTNAGVGWRF